MATSSFKLCLLVGICEELFFENTTRLWFIPFILALFQSPMQYHTIYSKNNIGQKCKGNCGLWVLNEMIKKYIVEIWKKLWVPFGSYLLNSTANPAQFEWKLAGLAVLLKQVTPKQHPRFFSNFLGYIF